MAGTSFYWLGFEDGFSGCSFRDQCLTVQQAYLYRKGFKDGIKAAEEAAQVS